MVPDTDSTDDNHCEVFEKYGDDDFLDDDGKVEYDSEKPLHGDIPWWDTP